MTGRVSLLIGTCLSAGLFLLAGCHTVEIEGLKQENAQLQAALSNETMLREAAERRLAAEAAARGGGAATPTDAGAFSGIEGVEAIAGQGKVTVRVPGDVLFASGQAALKPTAMKTLTSIADVLSAKYKDATIRVEGYTDIDPIRHSGWTDNLELSLARAASVYRYLHGSGVDVRRMYAAGFGEQSPRASKALSRRVEIVVVTAPQVSP